MQSLFKAWSPLKQLVKITTLNLAKKSLSIIILQKNGLVEFGIWHTSI